MVYTQHFFSSPVFENKFVVFVVFYLNFYLSKALNSGILLVLECFYCFLIPSFTCKGYEYFFNHYTLLPNTMSGHAMMLRLFLTLAVECWSEAPSQLDAGCCWPQGQGS